MDTAAVTIHLSHFLGKDYVMVQVAGNVDSTTMAEFRTRLLTLLRRYCRRLIVDLSDVTELDLHGLTALLATRRRALLLGGWLRLVAPSDSARYALQTSGLARVLPTFVDEQEAAAAVVPRPRDELNVRALSPPLPDTVLRKLQPRGATRNELSGTTSVNTS